MALSTRTFLFFLLPYWPGVTHGTDSGYAGAVVTVGESQHWVDSLVERAQKLKVGEGFDPSTDV